MKRTLLLAVLCSFFVCLNAQIQKLAVYQISSSYQIDLAKDQIGLKDSLVTPNLDSKVLTLKSRLQNNELIIDYQLKSSGAESYYVVQLEATMNGEKISPSLGYLMGDWGKVSVNQSGAKQMIWTNLIKDLPETEGQLELRLEVEWWGLFFLPYGVDCSQIPEFGFRQKRPIYTGLALSAGSFALGVIERRNAKKQLEIHISAQTLRERNTAYTTYVDDLKRAEIFTYVGVGILILDAAYYLYRRNKHNKRLEVYGEHCNKRSLSFRPFGDLPTSETPANVGLLLTHQF